MGISTAGIGFISASLLFLWFGGAYVERVQLYQRAAHRPPVIRVYQYGSDRLFVEDFEKKNVYQPLDKYLSRIPDKTLRATEEVDIKAAARWYEE